MYGGFCLRKIVVCIYTSNEYCMAFAIRGWFQFSPFVGVWGFLVRSKDIKTKKTLLSYRCPAGEYSSSAS